MSEVWDERRRHRITLEVLRLRKIRPYKVNKKKTKNTYVENVIRSFSYKIVFG